MNEYGPEYVTLTDEDGKEYEMEILDTIEYQGSTYYALYPADKKADGDEIMDITILKAVEENGETFLDTIMDDDEEDAVFQLFLDQDEYEDGEEDE